MTGVQRSSYEITSRLVGDDPERYRLFSPKPKIENPTSLPVEYKGRIRQGHLWEQLELPRLVRESGKKAVLYSPMTSGPLAVGRQVVMAHDLFPIDHPEWFSRAFSAWYGWLMPRLFRKAAYVLANSQYTRQRVLDHFGLPEDKVVLCHLAHSERFHPVSKDELKRFREDQGLPERYLLYVGSVEPRKNLATLAAAWKLTSAREQGVKLVVAGGAASKAVFNAAGSGMETLKDPTIRLLGYFADEHLPFLYGAAEAFALPSLAEGFGLPVLEAMACGTPVICSETTAMPEVAGGAARLVPPMGAEAWAEAIDSVLSDPDLRGRMSSDGRRRAEHFSWSKAAGIVHNVLDTV
jgi:glycosyltransferase involved in cell wall biosynthesis